MAGFRCVLCAVVVTAFSLFSASCVDAELGDCGQPHTTGPEPTAADALFVLRVSVALSTCNRCICDVDDSGTINTTDALLDLKSAVGQISLADCPACDPDGHECPGVAQFALFAKIRGACTSNADCAAFSACDTSIHRCRTATDSDVGWTGFAHNADTDDPVPARVILDCDGPPPCGECTIIGHDPSLGNCRCASDNRQPCFTVAGPDATFCGGGQCVCYFGPPMPLSSSGVPVCVLNTLASQPGGHANVDAGSGTIQLHLAEKIFTGITGFQPCPVCVNDTTPADGMRNGVCVGGANDTQSCDAQAYNSTFPPPTGALYSLDCFPLANADISAGGLRLEIALTTGHTELAAEVPCATEGPFAELDCPCRVCSGDATLPCNTDAECEQAEAGTCSSNGGGQQTAPNACETGLCESAGGNQGRCSEGPDNTYCDAVVRADGSGLLSCGSNEDCTPASIGVDAGDCTIVERRPCFLDPIVSQGFAHPVVPLASATYCSPASVGPSVNAAAGLPGPGRLTLQTAVTLFCKDDPESHYTPGVGGCP